MFSIFAKTSIKYLEMRELETDNIYNDHESEEVEETLFGEIDEKYDFPLDEHIKPTKEMNSFWGNNIKKTDTSIPKYTMDMFIGNHKNRR